MLKGRENLKIRVFNIKVKGGFSCTLRFYGHVDWTYRILLVRHYILGSIYI